MIDFVTILPAFEAIGGWQPFADAYLALPPPVIEIDNATVTCPWFPREPYAFHLFQDLDGPFPWPGMIFGLGVSATWYVCTDQVCKC